MTKDEYDAFVDAHGCEPIILFDDDGSKKRACGWIFSCFIIGTCDVCPFFTQQDKLTYDEARKLVEEHFSYPVIDVSEACEYDEAVRADYKVYENEEVGNEYEVV